MTQTRKSVKTGVDGLYCPYCTAYSDEPKLLADAEECDVVVCPNCDERFNVDVSISRTYATWPREEPAALGSET